MYWKNWLITGVTILFCFCFSVASAADRVVVIPMGTSTASTTTSPADIVSVFKQFVMGEATETLLTLPSDKGFILTGIDVYNYGVEYLSYSVEELSGVNTVKFTDNIMPPMTLVTTSTGQHHRWTGKTFASGISFSKGSKVNFSYLLSTASASYLELLIQGYYY